MLSVVNPFVWFLIEFPEFYSVLFAGFALNQEL
jgi:hypothetical protein